MGKAKKFRAAKGARHQAHREPEARPGASRTSRTESSERKRKKKQADRHVDQTPASMFFAHNTGLGPHLPRHCGHELYQLLSIKNKIDLVKGMTDCLLAKCVPVILDSVMAELEKLGTKYRIGFKASEGPASSDAALFETRNLC